MFFRLENLESHVASQQTDINIKDDKIDTLQKRYSVAVKIILAESLDARACERKRFPGN